MVRASDLSTLNIFSQISNWKTDLSIVALAVMFFFFISLLNYFKVLTRFWEGVYLI